MCLQPRCISINANICAIIACFQKLSFSRGYRGHLRALPASGTEEQVLYSLSALEVVDFDASGIMKAVVAALSFLQQSDTDGCFNICTALVRELQAGGSIPGPCSQYVEVS